MKTKFYIIIVLAMLLFALTITAGGKPSDLPEQANPNALVNKNSELLLFHFQRIADRLYQKNGWVPSGIEAILIDLGR